MNLDSFTVEAITRRRPLTSGSNPTTTIKHHDRHEADPLHQPSNTIAATSSSTTTINDNNNSSNSNSNSNNLQRRLNLVDLVFYGVGCSVGAGIYSLVGIGAGIAGPAISLSFAVCGMACCCTSFCYAEFASRVPLAGSAYVFTYISFGELPGWCIGWNLTLGYAVSAAVVARSWAEYVVSFCYTSGANAGIHYLTKFPLSVLLPGHSTDYTCCPLSILIVLVCTIVLVTGVKESAKFNSVMTILNLSILVFVLTVGILTSSIQYDNLIISAPLGNRDRDQEQGGSIIGSGDGSGFFPHGTLGLARGAGLVFFAYLGFDMVACLSEEVENPQRNLPIGIIGSLLFSMTIYVSVSLVVVGMTPIPLLGEDTPIVNALLANACCTHLQQQEQAAEIITTMSSTSTSSIVSAASCLAYDQCHPILHPLLYYGSRVVSFGAIFGLTTAVFACLMGQPRIFYSMATDGLLFPLYAKVHPRTGVPTTGTILTGIMTAIVACFIDLESLANAISLGTLQVFTFVCAGIILLRTRTEENHKNTDYNSNNKNHIDGNNNNNSGDHKDKDKQQSTPTIQQSEQSPLMHVADERTTIYNTHCSNSPSTFPSTTTSNMEPQAMEVAKWLGLHSEPSLWIRESLRQSQPLLTVSDNGTKPVWLVVCFTISATISSYAFSNNWSKAIVYSGIAVMIVSAILLFQLPQSPPPNTFACPQVPLLPLLGILFNSYMMGSLPGSTWLAIGLWLLLGLVFYGVYGIHHSNLRDKNDNFASSSASS